MLRTHNCGELGTDNEKQDVVLCGWISSRRDHGDIIFMDLRDKHGVTQIVFDPARNKKVHSRAHDLRNEFCVRIHGNVSLRPEESVNPAIPTGGVEVNVDRVDIFSRAETPPFEIKEELDVSEELRLKYRYLDLRRASMQEKLRLKHRAYKSANDFLDSEDFVNVETPVLTKSTPEGARDFLVPSRVNPGSFYALPQSPQIFKQLLMVGGVERYYQIVRCFRDEDLRADRQPEFCQLDMEMSFVEQEDIIDLCERLFRHIFNAIGGELEVPFPRLTHAQAMERYGTDKPDTSFELFLHDLTETAGSSEFKIFRKVRDKDGSILAIAAPGYGNISRKQIDDLTSFAGEYGAKGLAYFKVKQDGMESPITKFFKPEQLEMFRKETGAQEGDMIFMVADTRETACAAMSALRQRIAEEQGLSDSSGFNFLWVVDFPLFKYDRDQQRWVSEHHPFTSFRKEDEDYLDSGELHKIRSTSYDLVLNGTEIGSGSIRIHAREVQQRIFDILGIKDKECREKFGFLLEAFKYGAPPHGGIAFGMDRLIAMIAGDSSIREVIPFPKTQRGVCPLTGAPSGVGDEQLEELGLEIPDELD